MPRYHIQATVNYMDGEKDTPASICGDENATAEWLQKLLFLEDDATSFVITIVNLGSPIGE